MNDIKPRLDQKVAIVTGAGSSGSGFGTGKAIAVLFAREGCNVLLVDKEKANADQSIIFMLKKNIINTSLSKMVLLKE